MKLPVISENPIIVHSLRNWRSNWRMVAAVVLALLTYSPACLIFSTYVLGHLIEDSDRQAFFRGFDEMSSTIFYTTAIFLLVIITLFAPTMAASAIAGEKQRQTLDLLLVTLLPTRKLVAGKLVSALIYTLFLIAIVWPVILFCLVTGGVAIAEFVVAALLLMMTAMAFTTVGLFVSSLSRTTTNATMLTYGVALPLLLIGPFLGMLPVTIALSLTDVSYKVVEVVNVYGWSLAASLNPISAAVYSAVLRIEEGGWLLVENSVSSWPNYLIYPWVVYMFFYGFLSWFLTQLTIRRLERMSE